MTDGSLSDINPEILALASDPEAWKEARRAAARARIAGRQPTGASQFISQDANNNNNNNGTSGSFATNSLKQSSVLEQISSMKRTRREQAEDSAGAQQLGNSTQMQHSSGSPENARDESPMQQKPQQPSAESSKNSSTSLLPAALQAKLARAYAQAKQ